MRGVAVGATIALALACAACAARNARPAPPITPARIPFSLAPMSHQGRTLAAPVGTEIAWSTDGSASALVDGGIGRVFVFAQRTKGTEPTEREVRRLFRRSLERLRGPLMREVNEGTTIYCQESAPLARDGPALRFAACVRLDERTRRERIVTIAVFGTMEGHFVRLGGARFCAEILRTARGFSPR